MQIRLFTAVAAVTVAYHISPAHPSICSEQNATSTTSTSCYEEYFDGNECQSVSSNGTALCTRIEISSLTLRHMHESSIDDGKARLSNILGLITERLNNIDPLSGIALTYTEHYGQLTPSCSVYIRDGILGRLDRDIYTFASTSECVNVGMSIFTTFFTLLRERITVYVQPYDKLLFANYPIDSIRTYFEEAEIDPAHAGYSSLVLNRYFLDDLPEFSSISVPAKLYRNHGFKSLRAFTSNLEEDYSVDAWRVIWAFNYDNIHDPLNVPDGLTISVPLVATSLQDWQGPFMTERSPEALAKEMYQNESATEMIRRIVEIADEFGEDRFFLPNISGEFQGAAVLFFE